MMKSDNRYAVSFKPTSIEVNHIGRKLMRSKLLGHLAHLIFSVVCDTADPEAKGPEWWDWTTACQSRVFRYDLFWLSEEYKKIQVIVTRIDHVVRIVKLPEVESQRRAGMYEHAIPVAAQKERYGLVREPLCDPSRRV